MCTRVLWPDANGSVIVGRNMDFERDLLTNIWKMPRGMEREDGVNGSLKWRSLYGSIVATAYDLIATDGMNEEGLAGHILWLAESDYGTPKPTDTQLSQAVWLQYYLDNFATVSEAVAWTQTSDVRISQIIDPTGKKTPTLHLALNDASGDSAIIEYVNGKASIYHDRSYKVMTNSPSYGQQLELVQRFSGLGGKEPLPGSTLASDRFARASYYVEHQVQPKNRIQAMAAMFSIIRNAAQPFRTPEPGKPDASQTIWQVVADLTNKRYAFESTTQPNVVWVELGELSFEPESPVTKLDLTSELSLEGGLAANVTRRFRKVTELELTGLQGAVDALEFMSQRQDEFQEVVSRVLTAS